MRSTRHYAPTLPRSGARLKPRHAVSSHCHQPEGCMHAGGMAAGRGCAALTRTYVSSTKTHALGSSSHVGMDGRKSLPRRASISDTVFHAFTKESSRSATCGMRSKRDAMLVVACWQHRRQAADRWRPRCPSYFNSSHELTSVEVSGGGRELRLLLKNWNRDCTHRGEGWEVVYAKGSARMGFMEVPVRRCGCPATPDPASACAGARVSFPHAGHAVGFVHTRCAHIIDAVGRMVRRCLVDDLIQAVFKVLEAIDARGQAGEARLEPAPWGLGRCGRGQHGWQHPGSSGLLHSYTGLQIDMGSYFCAVPQGSQDLRGARRAEDAKSLNVCGWGQGQGSLLLLQ